MFYSSGKKTTAGGPVSQGPVGMRLGVIHHLEKALSAAEVQPLLSAKMITIMLKSSGRRSRASFFARFF